MFTPPKAIRDDAPYWLAVQTIPGLGRAVVRHLAFNFGDLRAAWAAKPSQLLETGLSNQAVVLFTQWRKKLKLEKFRSLLLRQFKFLTILDDDYPLLLKESPDPPPYLFCQGYLGALAKPLVAVIGSRQMSSYGETTAKELVAALVKKDVGVVSGLAIGIDALAHRTALANHGATIAVLASGLLKIRPLANEPLAQQIAKKGGLLLTEYPPYAPPTDYTFPERNRIIAGLVQAVVVVEAGQKSGTFITAGAALDANREVLAVPGPINAQQSRGTNRLLAQGAVVYTSPQDVLQLLR